MVNAPACHVCGTPLRWFADQQMWGCDRCRQMFPPPQVAPVPQAPPAPRPRGSKKPLAIAGGLVVVAAAITIIVVATRKKEHRPDMVDLENEQLQAVRDDACACKDEACLREAVGRIDEIRQRTDDSGQKADDEQHALTIKTMDEIGACIDKASKGASGATGAAGDAIAEEKELNTAMCACKDMTCARALKPRLDAWTSKYMPVLDAAPDAVQRESLALSKERTRCIEPLYAAEKAGGATAPAPPSVFAGSYKTDEGDMTLEQTAADPTTVTGTYAKGTLLCKAGGDLLACAWTEKTSSGRAHFKRAANGNMTGTWGLGNASSGGGPWNCTLVTGGALR